MEATVDRFGRIVIPKKIRDDFNLKTGAPLRIVEGDNEIVLKPIEGEPSLIEKDGVLVFTGKAVGNIEDNLEQSRRERIRFLKG